jgi:hypothetical protein
MSPALTSCDNRRPRRFVRGSRLRFLSAAACLSFAWLAALATPAAAFVPFARWSNIPASGYYPGAIGDEMGDPLRFTWSIVPDGTTIPAQSGIHSQANSSLINFLDSTFGIGPGGSNLTQRPWFTHIQQAFDRWSQLGGITFTYEPNDSAANALGGASGVLGVRGDIRIGGTLMDGANGTLAYANYPSNGDLVLDTGDSAYLGNSQFNYRRLRNTLMHELGHSFGLAHVVSDNAAFLLEPSITIGFDGPQLDDIRGLHWYYGDALEKTNNGQGNDSSNLAWSLGSIAAGATKSIGTSASPDLVVAAVDTDFVSIDNNFDVDYYSFTVSAPVLLSAVLTPLGGTFNQAAQGQTPTPFNANDRSDLALEILDTNGATPLAVANIAPAGSQEMLSGISLPDAGQYYARITGSSEIVQLYQLQLSISAAVVREPGDYNDDGMVDAADYTTWRNAKGSFANPPGTGADGTGPSGVPDGVVDLLDYQYWKANYVGGSGSGGGSLQFESSIPEPAASGLAVIALLLMAARRQLRR